MSCSTQSIIWNKYDLLTVGLSVEWSLEQAEMQLHY